MAENDESEAPSVVELVRRGGDPLLELNLTARHAQTVADLLARLDRAIERHGMSHRRDRILAAAKGSIRMVPAPGATGSGSGSGAESGAARSHLGGVPRLAPGQPWPVSRGRPLSLVAEIDLAALATFSPELPNAGLLAFFTDLEELAWGGGGEREGFAVVYTPEESLAETVTEPPAPSLPRRDLACTFDITIPAFRSIEIDVLELADEDYDRYVDLRAEVLGLVIPNGPVHRVFGHPDAIQGCMQRTLQFETRGLSLPKGVYSWYEHPRAAELIPGAFGWRLLLQVDSDDSLDTMWGDSGKLFFWIDQHELAAGRLEGAWPVLQCY